MNRLLAVLSAATTAFALTPALVVAQIPLPEFTNVEIPDTVAPGEVFPVEIVAVNRGVPAATGSISISFPDRPQVTIVTSDAVILSGPPPSALPPARARVIEPPEPIFNVTSGGASPALYPLAEAFYDRAVGWRRGEEHWIRLNVAAPPRPTTLRVVFRVTLRADSGRFYTAPSEGDLAARFGNVVRDQQGFPAQHSQVRVILQPSPAPTLAPTLAPPPTTMVVEDIREPATTTEMGNVLFGIVLVAGVAGVFAVAIIASRPRVGGPATRPSGAASGSPRQPAAPPPVQQTVPQRGVPTGFRTIQVIGRGGMATVYKAEQPSLGRLVALKVLSPQLAADSGFVERFHSEARIAAGLEHPNIVPIYDMGQSEHGFYIVMRYVDGLPLDEVLRRSGALPPHEALHLATQVAGALDYAHSKGVVHRDVKPSNIMVEGGNRAILTDFGIAKAIDSVRLTRTGTLVGTPEYMAPEQARGDTVDYRADLYALAVVLFELLTGRVPFHAETGWAVINAQINSPPPPPSQVRPGLPPTLDRVFQKALAKDPKARFANSHAFIAAVGGAVSSHIRLQ